jgi:hypothetical protein
MPRIIKNRREEARYGLPRDLGAEVEIDGTDGAHHCLPLAEISVGGFAFLVPERLPGIAAGAMLNNAVIRVGRLEIRGNLEVLHVSRSSGSEYKCGAQYYPATDADRNELISLVARLDSLPKH